MIRSAVIPTMLCIASLAKPAVAAAVSLWDSAAPIVIEGRVGDDAAFMRKIRVVSDTAIDVLVDATPLTGPLGREVGIHQITIAPNPIALVPGVPKDLDIKIGALKKPGVYKGAIAFVSATLSAAPTAPPPQALAMATAQATTATVAAERASRAGAPARTLSPFVRALSRMTGVTAEARAELALWVLRPMLYLVLLLGLLIVVLQQLYVKNPAFGANAISDYFGLFVWAMSADVASRIVSALKTGA